MRFDYCFPEELHSITDTSELIHLLTSSMGNENTTTTSNSIAPNQLSKPPQYLVAAIYERSFFTDTKLGEIQLPLTCLTLNKPYRGWVPLINPSSTSTASGSNTNSNTNSNSNSSSNWFVHLQLQLKFPVKVIETAAVGNTNMNTGNISNVANTNTTYNTSPRDSEGSISRFPTANLSASSHDSFQSMQTREPPNNHTNANAAKNSTKKRYISSMEELF